VTRQITKGPWVVRGVQKVDEEQHQIWFSASGMDAGKDPYFSYYFRINFDGTGLTRLTSVEANHDVNCSSDMKYYTDLRIASCATRLFHPEFYKASVAAAGCHDNRTDKIWWNEQWMGRPIGPQYAESSNGRMPPAWNGDPEPTSPTPTASASARN
jgi:hypothetical protein